MKRIVAILTLLLLGAVSPLSGFAAAESGAVRTVGLAEAELLLGDIAGVELSAGTRGEVTAAAAGILRLQADETRLLPYTDVPGTHPSFSGILAAQQNGLVSDGETFEPDAPITADQAVKICMEALGYHTLAGYQGGYPAGYWYFAKRSDLLDGTGLTQGAEASAEQVKLLLANMMRAEYLTALPDGDEIRFDKNPQTTILSVFYDCYRAEGIVTRTPFNSLGYESGFEPGDRLYLDDGEGYRLTDRESAGYELLGKQVVVYYRGRADRELVGWVENDKNQSLVFDAEDGVSVEGNTIRYQTEARERTARLSPDYTVIYNGRASAAGAARLLEIRDGLVRLWDNNRDGLYDLVWMFEYSYLVVDSVSVERGMVYDSTVPGSSLDLSDNSCIYRIDGKSKDERDIIDLKAEQVLQIQRSEDGLLVNIEVLSETVSGEIKTVKEDRLEIDGAVYEYTGYFKQNYFQKLQVGKSGSFVADGGKLVFYANDQDEYAYGYLVSACQESTLSGNVLLKLFTQGGQMQVYQARPKVRLDGRTVKAEELYRAVTSGGSTVSQMIRYLLKDGLIAGVDLAEAAGQEEFGKQDLGENTLRRYEFASQSFTFLTGSGVMFPYFNINNTTVFVIPADPSSDEDYKIKDRNYFIGHEYAVIPYDIGPDGCASVITYVEKAENRSINVSEPSFVVEEVVQALDEDGDQTYGVFGWRDGKYASFVFDPRLSLIKSSGQTLGFGDIIRCETEGRTITSFVVDFDADPAVFAPEENTESLPFNRKTFADYSYAGGKLYSISDGYGYLSDVCGEDRSYDFSYSGLKNVPVSTNAVLIVDRERKELRAGALGDVKTYVSSGQAADYVVLRQLKYYCSALIIYTGMEG